jgi:hypothetical protein
MMTPATITPMISMPASLPFAWSSAIRPGIPAG